jgi:broad specificity phosphatase PhoE
MDQSLFLIRHGELENPQQVIYDHAIHLSEEGENQMLRLGQTLKEKGANPSVIISSPYIRVIRSSEMIQQSFPNVSITIDERLHDTLAPDIVGRPLSWLRQIPDVYNDPETKHLIAETPEQITERMISAINEAREKYIGDIFIVSHGDPTMFAMWRLLHPEGKIPSMAEIKAVRGQVPGALEKGQAWKVVLDPLGRVREHEHITPKQFIIRREREI